MRRQKLQRLDGDKLVVFGDPFGKRTQANHRFEAWVQRVHSRQVVQDALVNSHRSRRKAMSRLEFHQAEMTQRAARRQGAPMRLRQRRHRQTEGGIGPLGTAESRTAQGR